MIVTHDNDHQSFKIITEGGESILRYRVHANVIDFYTTFVHPADRGSRVGVSLVKAAVDWAQQQGFSMLASCWYVDKYLAKHSLK
jgi:predicted GNAT family acetyltransferase